jgi:tetratricopeptide (TPR) repeat protein
MDASVLFENWMWKPQNFLALLVASWSEELIDRGAPAEAIALRKFNVQLHSESTDVYAALGAAHQQSGQKHAAIDNYRKALEGDPMNADALWKLDGQKLV